MLRTIFVVFLMAIVPMATSAAEILPRVAGTWKVTSVKFGSTTAISEDEAKTYIGKKLEQDRGYLESPFGSCKFCGLTVNYTKHTAKELIREDANYGVLKFPNGYALVHELTWSNGQGITMIQVDNRTAYVPLDGAFFLLKLQGD